MDVVSGDVEPRIFGDLAIAVIGGLVGTFFWRTATRLNRRIDEASADRRAFQVAMGTFRVEMQRLAERQSHLEGRLDAGTSTGD